MSATETVQATTPSTSVEQVPTIWRDARDVPFFRIVTHVFSMAFIDGAGVLLASYDDETD